MHSIFLSLNSETNAQASSLIHSPTAFHTQREVFIQNEL